MSESASLTCRDRAVKKKKWKEFAAALEINLQDTLDVREYHFLKEKYIFSLCVNKDNDPRCE